MRPERKKGGVPPIDQSPKTNPDIDPLVEILYQLAADKKARNPVAIDVRGACSYADFVLICSGRSDRQVQTIASHIEEQMKKEHGVKPLGVEGVSQGHWVLMDFGNVVVHVFYAPVRELYDLERLWPDAPRVDLDTIAEP